MNKLDAFKKWVINEYSSTLPYYVNKGLIQENIPLKWIVETSLIVHRLSEMPWYTQEQILNETSLTKDELITLNSFIRKSKFLQDVIVHHGLGRKYWNTIIPYVKSGKIDKVINYEYDFPLRLALFPGMSCMYYCGFCGRNQSAAYDPKKVLKSGVDRYKDIISSYLRIQLSLFLED